MAVCRLVTGAWIPSDIGRHPGAGARDARRSTMDGRTQEGRNGEVTLIVAVDPACGGTGLFSIHNGAFRVETIKTPPTMPPQARWNYIAQQTWPHGRSPGVSRSGEALMMIEQPPAYAGAAGATALLNGGLFAVLTYEWWGAGIPFVVIQPTQLKQFATGSGAASKDDVLLAAERTYADVITPVSIHNNNEADALTMCAMACFYYGRPLASVSGRQSDVLIARHPKTGKPKIAWPDWDPEWS